MHCCCRRLRIYVSCRQTNFTWILCMRMMVMVEKKKMPDARALIFYLFIHFGEKVNNSKPRTCAVPMEWETSWDCNIIAMILINIMTQNQAAFISTRHNDTFISTFQQIRHNNEVVHLHKYTHNVILQCWPAFQFSNSILDSRWIIIIIEHIWINNNFQFNFNSHLLSHWNTFAYWKCEGLIIPLNMQFCMFHGRSHIPRDERTSAVPIGKTRNDATWWLMIITAA